MSKRKKLLREITVKDSTRCYKKEMNDIEERNSTPGRLYQMLSRMKESRMVGLSKKASRYSIFLVLIYVFAIFLAAENPYQKLGWADVQDPRHQTSPHQVKLGFELGFLRPWS